MQHTQEFFLSGFIGISAFVLMGLVSLLMQIRYNQREARKNQQKNFIKNYQFSSGFKSKFAKRQNQLSPEQQELVLTALKDYFTLCYKAGKEMISMPSQIVDEAWHELILFTQEYEAFCQQAFGRFLHHTPAEAMDQPTQAQDGIKRAWRLACVNEGINPKKPDRLPLLFGIDAILEIENGFYYTLSCSPLI